METTISYTAASDETLAILFQEGDLRAGNVLAERYTPLVWSLCRASFVRTFEEDLEQDLWLRFFEAIHAYDPEKKAFFAGYIKAILTYERWNQFKAARRRWDKEGTFPETGCGEPTWEPDMTNLSEEDLRQCIETLPLPARQKEMILLLLEGPQTAAELGRRMHTTQQTAYISLKRLRVNCQKLKREGKFF